MNYPHAFLLQKMSAMETKEDYKDLHIGQMVKEIAMQKHVSTKRIAGALNRHQKNAAKIYQLEDMYLSDIVILSFTLDYHFLEVLSERYLSHLPYSGIEQEACCIVIDIRSNQITNLNKGRNKDILKEIDIGREIKKRAKEKGWSEKYLAKQLGCSQSVVNGLYQSDDIKLKKLLRVSEIFKHNFITDVYLSRMNTAPFVDLLYKCIISISEQQVIIKNQKEPNFTVKFRRILDDQA